MADPSTNSQNDEDWTRHLTPELRKYFKQQGRYLVEQQVLHLKYKRRDKRLAAMTWLGEQRRKDERKRFLIIFVWIIATIVAALGGAYLGASATHLYALKIEERRAASARQFLVDAFISEIEATRRIESERRETLDPVLDLMVEKDSLREEGGRPWLMPSASSRFPVFEANAARLGSLEAPLPTEIARFYGLSYELRNHINLVVSPAILWANGAERASAVKEYRQAHQAWQAAADQLLVQLRDCCPRTQ